MLLFMILLSTDFGEGVEEKKHKKYASREAENIFIYLLFLWIVKLNGGGLSMEDAQRKHWRLLVIKASLLLSIKRRKKSIKIFILYILERKVFYSWKLDSATILRLGSRRSNYEGWEVVL